MPTDHGRGQPVIAGVVRVFLERLVQAGGAVNPSLETGYTVPFDPEVFKLTALDLLDEAGVQYLLHSLATEVTQVLGVNVWDLTYAEWEGRRPMRQISAFLQKYVPGFESAYAVQSGVNVGVRETRRIQADGG